MEVDTKWQWSPGHSVWVMNSLQMPLIQFPSLAQFNEAYQFLVDNFGDPTDEEVSGWALIRSSSTQIQMDYDADIVETEGIARYTLTTYQVILSAHRDITAAFKLRFVNG